MIASLSSGLFPSPNAIDQFAIFLPVVCFGSHRLSVCLSSPITLTEEVSATRDLIRLSLVRLANLKTCRYSFGKCNTSSGPRTCRKNDRV